LNLMSYFFEMISYVIAWKPICVGNKK
jgi:hypothetical protein